MHIKLKREYMEKEEDLVENVAEELENVEQIVEEDAEKQKLIENNSWSGSCSYDSGKH